MIHDQLEKRLRDDDEGFIVVTRIYHIGHLF